MYHLCLGIKIFQTLNYLIMDNLINSWESNVHMFFFILFLLFACRSFKN